MARRNSIFHGINRSAEYAGLPVIYLMAILGFGLAAIAIGGLYLAIPVVFALYVALRLFYEWEPAFFKILWVSVTKTPRTKNFKHHGGDRYRA